MKGTKQDGTKQHSSWWGRHSGQCTLWLLLGACCAAALVWKVPPSAAVQENVWKGTAIKTLRVPEVKLSGLARACAGGINDPVHTIELQVQTTQKSLDGSPGEVMKEVKLLFHLENNKGHDYGDGRETKKARFVAGGEVSADGEEMKVTTDAAGKAQVEIRSSDIVSQDIKLKVRWLLQAPPSSSGGAQEVDIEVPLYHNDVPVQEVACDFGEAVSYRRFPNRFDPDETADTGWLFDYPQLDAPGASTPAKVYMKFMKDPGKGDIEGNWEEVNGHWLRIKVLSNNGDKDYAFVVNPSNPDAGMKDVKTSGDGGAQAVIQAGEKVLETDEVLVGATDLSQWSR